MRTYMTYKVLFFNIIDKKIALFDFLGETPYISIEAGMSLSNENIVTKVEEAISAKIESKLINEIFAINSTKYIRIDFSEDTNFADVKWVDLDEYLLSYGEDDFEKHRLLNHFYRMGDIEQKNLCIRLIGKRRELIATLQDLLCHRNRGFIIREDNADSYLELLTAVDQANKKPLIREISVDKLSEDKEVAYCELMDILSIYFAEIIKLNAFFAPACLLSLTGLSESGKSRLSAEIREKYGFSLLKIKYFILQASLLVDKDNIKFRELYSIQMLIDYLANHHTVSKYLLESIYSLQIDNLMKICFGNYYKLIYIDAPSEIRKSRSRDSESRFDKKEKKKIDSGIFKLRDDADFVFDNTKSVELNCSLLESSEELTSFIEGIL